VCDITPDGWENDDGISQASLMEVDGTPRIHNFHQSGDMDWVKFNAVSGQNYVIQTSNNGGYADTVLYLYDTDGATLLDLNDDAEGLGWASQITWTAPTDGTYYLLVEHFDPNAFGCTAVYGLSVTPTTINYKLYLPVILRQ